MALIQNYFKSKDIKVFPGTFRGTYKLSKTEQGTTTDEIFNIDPESRLNTEGTFTLPRSMMGKNTYILEYANNIIKFVLHGYYFEISNIDEYKENLLENIYLNLKLRTINLTASTAQTVDTSIEGDLKEYEGERTTQILDSWESEEEILDKIISTENGHICVFTGLKATKTEETDAFSIKLFNTDGTLNQEAVLVDLDHGTGENTLMHGEGLRAGTANKTVFGTYNENKEDSLFEVGKGYAADSVETRINALEISNTTTTINNDTNINGDAKIEGNTKITGDTILGGNSNTNVVSIKTSPASDDVHVKITGSTTITDTTTINGTVEITKNTESTSSTNGALKVTGGVGVGKSLNVGENLTVSGDTNLKDKLIVKTSPTNTETDVKVNGTLNITGKTDICNNVTIDSDKTTLAKPVEITDTTSSTNSSTGALKVSGGVGIDENLNVGKNITLAGTVTASGKITEDEHLITKSYLETHVSNTIDALDVASIGENGKYLKTISEANGKITATAQAFDTSISSFSTNNNAPTSKAVNNAINTKINSLNVKSSGGFGQYIRLIEENNGLIKATTDTFDTTIHRGSTDNRAPTSRAVYDAINSNKWYVPHRYALEHCYDYVSWSYKGGSYDKSDSGVTVLTPKGYEDEENDWTLKVSDVSYDKNKFNAKYTITKTYYRWWYSPGNGKFGNHETDKVVTPGNDFHYIPYEARRNANNDTNARVYKIEGSLIPLFGSSYMVSLLVRFFNMKQKPASFNSDDTTMRINMQEVVKDLWLRQQKSITGSKYYWVDGIGITSGDSDDSDVKSTVDAINNTAVSVVSATKATIEPCTKGYPSAESSIYFSNEPGNDNFAKYIYINRSSEDDNFWGVSLQIIVNIS